MHQLIKLNLVFHQQLLLHVHALSQPRDPHGHPEVTLGDQVVDPLDPHQEPEDCIVVEESLSIKDDFKGPFALHGQTDQTKYE